MVRALLCFASIVISAPSFATIWITSVTGASGSVYPTPSTANSATTPALGITPTIFGGIAGADCSGGPLNGDGTCNSCSNLPNTDSSSNDIQVCATNRIIPTNSVSITFYSDSITNAGYPVLIGADGTSQIGTQGPLVGQNGQATVTVPWSTLCSQTSTTSNFSGNASCTTNNTFTMTLGNAAVGGTTGTTSLQDQLTVTVTIFDAGYNASSPTPTANALINDCQPGSQAATGGGVCYFEAFPGDSGVYLDQLAPGSTFPNADPTGAVNIQVNNLVLFYSTQGFQYVNLHASSSSFQVNNATSTTGTTSSGISITPSFQGGFTNDTYYFFRLGISDQATNVAFLTSDTAIEDVCGSGSSQYTAAQVNPQIDQQCPFIAFPDEVVGLLTKDLNCFIASAAYGSSLNKHLRTFRRFRAFVLMQTSWGKKLVHFYYTYGPYGARFLNAHEWLKPVVRALLWPTWWYADVSLRYGAKRALILSLSIVFSVVFLLWVLSFRVRRARRR